MNCPKCNATEIPNDANFCPNCGIAFNGHFENETYRFKVRGVLFSMVLVRHGDYGMSFDACEHFQDYRISYDYYILDSPVTTEQWHAVMFNPETPLLEPDEMEMPITEVTQKDCMDFVNKLNDKSQKKFDLPTREEWMYADFGGHLGHLLQTENINANSKPHKVKINDPNVLGLHDMHNNVAEWTKTSYQVVNEKNEIVLCYSSHGGPGKVSVLAKGDCSYSNMGFRIVLRAPKFKIQRSTTDMSMDDISQKFRDVFGNA